MEYSSGSDMCNINACTYICVHKLTLVKKNLHTPSQKHHISIQREKVLKTKGLLLVWEHAAHRGVASMIAGIWVNSSHICNQGTQMCKEVVPVQEITRLIPVVL